jgi:Na+/H+-dicarboxylate symporter
MAGRLTLYIVAGLLAGLALGWGLNAGYDDGGAGTAWLKEVAAGFGIVTQLFLRLIKMVIAPLVFSTLVVGIAHMGGGAALGRVGLRALGWFVGASFVSLLLGLAMVNLLRPGVGLHLVLPNALAASGVATTGFDVGGFVTHLVPESIIGAMAGNEILQIVVFSVFLGVAIGSLGERGRPLIQALELLGQAMLTVTGYVMWTAPIAVFAAVAGTLAERGPGVIGQLGYFMLCFYLALAILWTLLLLAGRLVVGRRFAGLIGLIRQPLLIGFTTATSEAAFPRTLEALERFGVSNRIASFVLPLGYSFNLDGSMMYTTFASLFIAQAYGIPLSLGQQLALLLTLMVTSKGIAGVPRASMVVIAAVLPRFGIPDAGLLLILAIDHFLDMGRTATNVIGNAVAASVVATWEGAITMPSLTEPVPAALAD